MDKSAASPSGALAVHWDWAAPVLHALCDREPDLLRMAAWGGADTAQFLAAMLAAELEAMAADPASWADRLAHASRTALLREAYGDVGPRLTPLLRRLGLRPHPRTNYARLARLAAIPAWRSALLDRAQIDAGTLAVLDEMLVGLLDPRLMHDRKPLDPDYAEPFRAAVLARIASAPDPALARAELRSLRRWPEVDRWLSRLEDPAVSLPAPRWAGDDLLEPVTDLACVLALAREFRNCLEDRCLDYLRGCSALYRSKDDSKLIVEVTWTTDGKPFLSNFQCRAPREVRARVRKDCEARLAVAGIAAERPERARVGISALVGRLTGEDSEAFEILL